MLKKNSFALSASRTGARPHVFRAGLIASCAAGLLLMPSAVTAQRSGVRSGVIGSAPIGHVQSGVIGGGYRGALIGRRERRGWVYPYSNPCIAWTGRLWVRVC
jgi:hypothetical protein